MPKYAKIYGIIPYNTRLIEYSLSESIVWAYLRRLLSPLPLRARLEERVSFTSLPDLV